MLDHGTAGVGARTAAICGLFSLVHGRYQSRVAPIAVCAVMIAVLALRPRQRVRVGGTA
jgi:hypothetical protein